MREREGTSGQRWPCQCQDERVNHAVEHCSFSPSLSAAFACSRAKVPTALGATPAERVSQIDRSIYRLSAVSRVTLHRIPTVTSSLQALNWRSSPVWSGKKRRRRMLTFCVSHASLLATGAYRPVARLLRSVSLSAVAQEGLAFESLSSLRPELLAGTQRLGYTTLTDIQERALPPALAGRDVVGKAKTGSGKTVVFGLALLQRLDMKISSAGRPQALVLSPTRELAQQLVGAVRGLAVGLDGTRVVAVTGGAISRQQRDAIAVCHAGL